MAHAADLAQVEASVGKVMSDLLRARGIVKDAISRLFTTFERLRDHLEVERVRYEQAVLAITGAANDEGLIAVIRDVIGRFVEDIVRLSQSSVKILVEVDALRAHAEQVATRGHRIEKIAQTTRVISLNARIEAQRVGHGGRVFRVVADEIKALANESGELSKAIRQAIAEQAASLEVTSRAASELASTDLNLAVESHKQLEETIARLGQVSQTSTQALDEIQRDIDSAIQALQFEDMLDQLLVAIHRKLAAIQSACGELAGTRPAAGALASLGGEVDRDAVHQQDVTGGSVELF